MGQRGRPKGAKNRPRAIIELEKADKEKHKGRGRGRPKGSPNKPKIEIDTVTASDGITGKQKRKYEVSETDLVRRRENFAVAHPQTADERDFNSRLIDHIMGIHEIASHADRHDLLSLKSCFIAYLKLCQQNGFSVLNLAAYFSMGLSKDDFNNMARGSDPEVREFCKMVRETCGIFRESLVETGKLNPVIGIFWQRNFDGLRNDTEQIQSALEQDDNYVNGTKAYKEKYRNLLGE